MLAAKAAFPPYVQYATDQLIEAFRQGPARLRASLVGLTETELRTRARGPEQWSAHEIVIHTVDSEIQGVYRIRKIWSQSGAELPSYDQDAWARELDYHTRAASSERENALQLLACLRWSALPIFERAAGADWDRWGVHPDYGKVTLRNMLELYADHVERHLAQILETRELLGKPLHFPLLLPDRLY